ncbi:MAG: porin [Alphaproteobacteria bacterium]|nr:porin [Alphaproteobacteria bacterium]
MKMVKSLLLVSAAGLVAVSGAQAADLPVKAKPVEYVKVCSLYGAGFYYVPGTDICLKVGAYFRAEYAVGTFGASLTNLDATGADGQRTRISGPDYQQRARAFIFLDTRQQTAYGTLRAYMNVGHSSDFAANASSAAAVYANRAFMQLAGFTWGLATSYYDFYSSPATSYSVPWSSDTGDGGWKIAAYTAQLGNGVSGTISFEEPRRQIVSNQSLGNPLGVGAVIGSGDTTKVRMPDFVGNLRIDQAWGSAQLMGAIHEVGGGYYGTTLTGSQGNGHPNDKIGFAVGAGIKINVPMIGPGDYLQAQVNYTEGASRYAATTPAAAGNPGIFKGGTSLGAGFFSDGIFCGSSAAGVVGCPAGTAAGQSVQLTTVWSAQAAYEHFWTPSLRTSLVGAYTDVSYNATASAQMCTGQLTGGLNLLNALTNCGSGSFDWSYYSISSRTQWNITKDFYVGLEGYYGHLNTMSKGQTVNYTANTGSAQPTGTRTLADQDVWVYRMRVHRDLVP